MRDPNASRDPIETGSGSASRTAEMPIPLPAGAYLAVALLAALLVQALTGVGLSFHYAPTATDAWASTARIESSVTAGAFLRAAHHAGTTVVIALTALLVVQAVSSAAWRHGKGGWFALIALLAVLPLAPMTGNLLPWDEVGYWQTQVEATIIGGAPMAGPIAKRVLIGGEQISSLTLTRYYALHVIVIPVAVGALAFAAFRTRRLRATWLASYRPMVVAGVVVLGLGLVAALAAAPLGAPADATSPLDVRPEWYFLPLFALRKLLEGPFEIVATLLAPGLALAGLAALPWFDPLGRYGKRLAALMSLGAVAMGALAGVTLYRDSQNREHVTAMNDADVRGERALEYALAVPPDVDGVPPLYRGMATYARESCGNCHASALGEAVEPSAPSLVGYLSRAWLRRFLDDPNAPEFFGRTALAYSEAEGTGMPSFAHLGADADQVVEFLVSLRGDPHDAPSAAKGATLFAEHCAGCHELTPTESVGPSLHEYGSLDWIASVILDPDDPTRYGPLGNKMPDHPHIGRESARRIAAWLRHEADGLAPSIPEETPK